ncbi:uncharacterized protein BHQ10_000686 [Talaromyces amestolkiae]|uniref:Uncharacterized protein n=1 Tax=Talaromyces amestolkiae TaxID=1196081 RepID=A0A364KM97_TALAM|nr:uncharacterized protein BHQ10_000686 [Talaromyces amestolkiae]RAO64674.1 hypothetical protein BHQ10_000686 [Talaromyces amestolkiae]
MILVDAMQKHDVLLETLFACLLLIVCEVLRGSDVAAQYHLDGAIRLICMPSVAKSQLFLANNNSNSNRSALSPFGLLKEVSLIFQQLDLQAAAFSGPRVPINPEDIGSITQYTKINHQGAQIAGKDVKSKSTIKELRQSLQSIQAKISRFVDSKKVRECKYRPRLKQPQKQKDELNAAQAMQENLHEQLEHWKTNLDTISPSPKEGLNSIKQCATIVMLLSYLTSYVLLSTSLSPDETAYDSHSATFARIIELSEIFSQQHLAQDTPLFFTFFRIDMKVVYPLYITALKCRDRTMRYRAVRLLSMCGREGVWDGRMMASIARSVITCEEEFAAKLASTSETDDMAIDSIPERARIHGVGIVEMDRERGDVKLICSKKTGMMAVDNQIGWEKVRLHSKF